MSKEAIKRLTRDDTEHGVEYYRADEVDALLAEQPAHQHIEHCLWARNGNQPCPHVQPAQQQPVAWMCSDARLVNAGFNRFSACKSGDWNIPVYTTPQAQPAQRKPLTDEEIFELASEHQDWDRNLIRVRSFARAIEAAHGIKENT